MLVVLVLREVLQAGSGARICHLPVHNPNMGGLNLSDLVIVEDYRASLCTATEGYETMDAYWIVRLDPGTHALFIRLNVGRWGLEDSASFSTFEMVCTASSN